MTEYRKNQEYSALSNSLQRKMLDKYKDISVTKIADKVGMSQVFISQVMKGNISLVSSRLYILLQLFPELEQVLINWLCGDNVNTCNTTVSKDDLKDALHKIIDAL